MPAVIDEWVSAPYPSNQSDRQDILRDLGLSEYAYIRFKLGLLFRIRVAARDDL